MSIHASVDIETYSNVDIKKAGLYKYAQSPAFDILLIAWAPAARPSTTTSGTTSTTKTTRWHEEITLWIGKRSTML